jgi:hypothetical protein
LGSTLVMVMCPRAASGAGSAPVRNVRTRQCRTHNRNGRATSRRDKIQSGRPPRHQPQQTGRDEMWDISRFTGEILTRRTHRFSDRTEFLRSRAGTWVAA